MQVKLGLIITLVLLGLARSSPLPQQQLEDDLIEAELQFINSLSPQQRGLWGKIKDKVTSVAINQGISLLAGAVLGKRDVNDVEIDEFFNSLTPQQRGLWGKIKDKVTSVAINQGISLLAGALIGKK